MRLREVGLQLGFRTDPGNPEQHGNGNDRIIPEDPEGGIGAKPYRPWENVNPGIWED